MGNALCSYASVRCWKRAMQGLFHRCLECRLWRILPFMAHDKPDRVSMTPAEHTPPPPTPEELIEKARTEYGISGQDELHIAVVGGSGVGKSSFVNGIRLLKDADEGAAPVGESNQLGSSIQRYPHPLLHRVVVWDFPGAESLANPAATYFDDMKLFAFDYILILSSDRFLRVDFEVAKMAQQRYKKPVAFVRTKADVSIRSIAERSGVTALEASSLLRRSVEWSLEEGLKYAGMSSRAPLFIVSNRAFTDINTYHLILHSAAPPTVDDSLHEMDEHMVYAYVADTVKPKLTSSKTFRATSQPSPQQAPSAAPQETGVPA